MIRLVVSIAAIALTALPAVAQENVSPWQQRENDLVTMSRLLGGLHHYHQLCMGTSARPALYRNRMKEMVGLEEPHDALEAKMVAAFNDGYQTASVNYTYCSREAEERMRQIAGQGYGLAQRLGAPYREIDNYDYDAGGDVTIENGVAVWRGEQ